MSNVATGNKTAKARRPVGAQRTVRAPSAQPEILTRLEVEEESLSKLPFQNLPRLVENLEFLATVSIDSELKPWLREWNEALGKTPLDALIAGEMEWLNDIRDDLATGRFS